MSASMSIRVSWVGDVEGLEQARALWVAAGASEVRVHAPTASVETIVSTAELVVLRLVDEAACRRIDEIRASSPSIPVAVWSPHPSVRGAVDAIRHGAIDYLLSPLVSESVANVIAQARAWQVLRRGNGARGEDAASGDEWQSLLGRSDATRRLARQIEAIARHDATVLIQGEIGTGKERVARLIQRLGRRATMPFVVCNCAAIVSTLAESLLFGHEKGAFTGARHAREGLFGAAQGGTLFLDQLQDLPPVLQPKLLRVLENREYTRVGAAHSISSDVRIIAASSRDLKQEVQAKRFRQDLYYRLAGATITIPPLRERREDIPVLVEHFLRHFCGLWRLSTRVVSRDVMACLMSDPWAGNIRELRNTIQHAVAVSQRSVITRRNLPRRFTARSKAPRVQELGTPELISLEELERNQIQRVLAITGRNVPAAARILGLSRSSLYRRFAELRLGR